MNIERGLNLGSRLITRASDSPRLDAEVIFSYIKKCDRGSLLAHTNEKLKPLELIIFLFYIWQRRRGKPAAYIIGSKEFYGRTFKVNKHTLIPRPDTELLIETAINLIKQDNKIESIADIGTGSGCIAITLAHELPHLKITASDISGKAIKIAKQNACDQKVINKIEFFQGDLLKPLILNKKMSPRTLITANLPYLKSQEYSNNLLYEPKKALVSGYNGLKHYNNLLKQVRSLSINTRPQKLILEISPTIADDFNKLVNQYFSDSKTEIINDLANLPRIAVINLI